MLLRKAIIAVLLSINTVSRAQYEDTEFSHYLNFYQVRYFDDQGKTAPFPKGLVKFTIGSRYGKLPVYPYVHFDSIDGHHRHMSKKTALSHYGLKAKELDVLFSLYGTNTNLEYGKTRLCIAGDKIQKKGIEKIHSELVISKPDLFRYGTELEYGVKQDMRLDVIKEGASNKPIPDSNVEEYRQGKTIVLPVSLRSEVPRLILNLNSPAVREYCIRSSIDKLVANHTRFLFIDNTSWTFYHTVAAKAGYFADGTIEEQVAHYASCLVSICEEIKKRVTPEPDLLGNGLLPWSRNQEVFLDTFTSTDALDGMMSENEFANDSWSVNVELWLDWIRKFKKLDKKVLFCTSSRAGVTASYYDSFVFQVWLWFHLIADENVYFYINKDYLLASSDYYAYHYPLGRPLEVKPAKVNNTWTRRYQRGTIIFDTTKGKLSAIKFAPNQIMNNK